MALQITPLDKNAANNGKWTSYRGVDLLIARTNTDQYKKAFREVMAPFQQQIEDESLSEEKSMELLTSILAKHILVGWKNFPDYNSVEGSTVEYTEANAKDLLLSDPDCLQFVQEFANNLNNFLVEEARRFKGKSVMPSAGS